jgi:hypothetical protein
MLLQIALKCRGDCPNSIPRVLRELITFEVLDAGSQQRSAIEEVRVGQFMHAVDAL